jgi:MinD superfamily P-loop ATPase
MKELTIISGKGGSGKTSLVAAFAALAENHILVDADVDAADLHLVLSPEVKTETEFKGGYKAEIDPDLCTACEICTDRCGFDAIDQEFQVDQTKCEGCGVCKYFCPFDAVSFKQQTCGRWFVSETRCGPMVHARLGIMEENSGMLVSLLRKEARDIAEANQYQTIIVDGPPGIGCPVISSMTGVDAVLIITEPSLSGLHDMKRVFELSKFLTAPAMVCVNKHDINPEITQTIISYAKENNIKYVGSIPYDPDVIAAMVAQQTLIEYTSGKAATAVKKIWANVSDYLEKLHEPIFFPKSDHDFSENLLETTNPDPISR